ncbi:MAG: HPr family phosphocarrier protein [Alphaproteobacteria bacterium]|nr:HPr family phosphocarrier protein [Alphaproteobacteria bacterium]
MNEPPADVVTRRLTVLNKRGLHARPAAKFVKLAEQFASSITVTYQGTTVSGLSIMGLLMLAAPHGGEIDVSADGPDADLAMAAIGKLIAERFGEA